MGWPLDEDKVPVVEVIPATPTIDKSDETRLGLQRLSNDEVQELQRRDSLLKRHVRILRFVSRLLNVVLSTLMVMAMLYTLVKYYSTNNRTISGGGNAWPNPAILWPTFMLLIIAVITMVMNLITFCCYCFGVQAANIAQNKMTYLSYAVLAAHTVVWVITTGIFKMANMGTDLWGWSCSDSADAIQTQVQSFINFNDLCMIQTGTWIITIIQTIAYILLLATYITVGWRFMHKRRLRNCQHEIS